MEYLEEDFRMFSFEHGCDAYTQEAALSFKPVFRFSKSMLVAILWMLALLLILVAVHSLEETCGMSVNENNQK